MKVSTIALFAASAMAQRPANISMCDYYTTALLTNNTAKNQYTVLTALVNTAVLGNAVPKPDIPGAKFTKPAGLYGILASNATYKGDGANLLPYFDGGLASSNRGGSSGVAVNFLDGGGAAPLEMLMAANNTNSAQYTLLTHLYQYFGMLLNCSTQGHSSDFPSYQGEASMYSVHKYMALNSSQVGYFIEQVGLAAESFGVTTADVTAVGMALTNLFDVRCGPATTVVPGQGPQLQSICTTSDCTQAMNASCAAYSAVQVPGVANSTLAMGEGNSSSTATATGSGAASTGMGGSTTSSGTTSPSSSTTPSSGASTLTFGGFLASLGTAAFAFLL